ncbi:pyridoxal phosphate-dependent aminotransferase [Pseudoduganella sp. RAF19]|uniref:pyridoxal phosphate-dependent aminotransferase n=1 Tax=Pseudoduganella sp. RAF19 TaxID=3233052 RepID=UPI003F9D9A53
MKLADRTDAVAPFFAMEFGKHAAALEAQGHHIIKLNIGEPDFDAPPMVVQAMHEAIDGGHTSYTAALGIPPLRKAIADFYQFSYGVTIDPSRVIVTAGASAALLLASAALVNAGDEVLVGDPSYPCNRHFMSSFGAKVKLVPTTAATRFQLNEELVREHWSARTRGLMIATPSNPTGTSVPEAELAALCQFAREKGAWRIVDEIYLGLTYGQERAPTILKHDPDAIVINSFSKYFGMTGWRLGWAIVPQEMVPVMERLAQNYYICPSAPTQYAALACFKPESLAICEERRLDLAKRRDLIVAGLKRIGLDVPVIPDGAFYVYIDVSKTGLDSMEFCERALQEAHVALTPGNDFGVCSANDHVRLSYAASSGELNAAVERLAPFIQKLL